MILGLLIDCAIVYCLFVMTQFFCGSYLIEFTNIMIFVAIGIFYIAFAGFNHWITPGIKLMARRKESLSVPMRKVALPMLLFFIDETTKIQHLGEVDKFPLFFLVGQ